MRFVFIILVFILVIVLLSISDEKLSKKAKISIIACFSLVTGFAYFYEKSSKSYSQSIKTITDYFIQGNTLNCKGMDVNSSNFDFSNATNSFTAKRDAKKDFKNQIFKASDCEIKKQKKDK